MCIFDLARTYDKFRAEHMVTRFKNCRGYLIITREMSKQRSARNAKAPRAASTGVSNYLRRAALTDSSPALDARSPVAKVTWHFLLCTLCHLRLLRIGWKWLAHVCQPPRLTSRRCEFIATKYYTWTELWHLSLSTWPGIKRGREGGEEGASKNLPISNYCRNYPAG